MNHQTTPCGIPGYQTVSALFVAQYIQELAARGHFGVIRDLLAKCDDDAMHRLQLAVRGDK